jgi:hypothetical protein
MGTIWSNKERAKAKAFMCQELEECVMISSKHLPEDIPVVLVVGFNSNTEAIIRRVLNRYNVEVHWHCDPSHLLINRDAIPQTTVRCFVGRECCELAAIKVSRFCPVTCFHGMSHSNYSSMLGYVNKQVSESMELMMRQGKVTKKLGLVGTISRDGMDFIPRSFNLHATAFDGWSFGLDGTTSDSRGIHQIMRSGVVNGRCLTVER